MIGFEGLWRAAGEYLGNATNQQAEIAAAAVGLESLTQPCEVTVLSDSRYVVETMGGTWKRKTNHEWWRRLDLAAQMHKITWKWVRGHSGHVVQEAADTLARETATLGRVNLTLLEETAADLGVVEIG